ncbi:hypothetical protein IQ243_26095 [Nostocales cyanobacterium LEGE 11386]|nr:hypothetical protein [Nostocales cyanobacterium LEGE 11386]
MYIHNYVNPLWQMKIASLLEGITAYAANAAIAQEADPLDHIHLNCDAAIAC